MHRNRRLFLAAALAATSVVTLVPTGTATALGVLPGCPSPASSSLPHSADAAERWIEHARRRCTLPISADAAEHWLANA